MAVNSIQFTKVEIQVVRHLFKHCKDKYNARQLARLLDLNHAHINKLCNLLLIKRLLKKEEIGNSAYFSFDYDNALAIKFMEYLLSLEENEFPRWLAVVMHNLKKFSSCVQLGLVFGSSIKSSRFNDIDVLLMYDKSRYREVRKIKEEIMNSQLIEQPIRYVDIAERDIVSSKDDKLFYSILSDSLVFYNSKKYVEVIKKCRT